MLPKELNRFRMSGVTENHGLWNKGRVIGVTRVVCFLTGKVSMIRLANLIVFGGCAVAVARYSGLGSTIELLGVVAVAAVLMRLLSSRRTY